MLEGLEQHGPAGLPTVSPFDTNTLAKDKPHALRRIRRQDTPLVEFRR